jgi:predicted double-glycine peptidase
MHPDTQKAAAQSKILTKRAHFPTIWRGSAWSGISVRVDGVPVDIRKRVGIPINLSDRVSRAASMRFVE